WIVSDFGLTEAIESGLVKIPFLPELDNTQELTPVLRNLYEHVRNELPRKGQKTARKESKSVASVALTTSTPSERVILIRQPAEKEPNAATSPPSERVILSEAKELGQSTNIAPDPDPSL